MHSRLTEVRPIKSEDLPSRPKDLFQMVETQRKLGSGRDIDTPSPTTKNKSSTSGQDNKMQSSGSGSLRSEAKVPLSKEPSEDKGSESTQGHQMTPKSNWDTSDFSASLDEYSTSEHTRKILSEREHSMFITTMEFARQLSSGNLQQSSEDEWSTDGDGGTDESDDTEEPEANASESRPKSVKAQSQSPVSSESSSYRQRGSPNTSGDSSQSSNRAALRKGKGACAGPPAGSNKRNRDGPASTENGEDEEDEEEDDRIKRQSTGRVHESKTSDEEQKVACPFRKRRPDRPRVNACSHAFTVHRLK